MLSPKQGFGEQNVKNKSVLRNKINEEKAFVDLYLSTNKNK
jgi:hypothetical protein